MSSSSDYEDSSSGGEGEVKTPIKGDTGGKPPFPSASRVGAGLSAKRSTESCDSSDLEDSSSDDEDDRSTSKKPLVVARKAATPVVSRPIVSQGSMSHHDHDDSSSEYSSSSSEDSRSSVDSEPDPFNSCMKPMARGRTDKTTISAGDNSESVKDESEERQIEKAARLIEKKQPEVFAGQKPSSAQTSMRAPPSSDEDDSSSSSGEYTSDEEDLTNQLPPARQPSDDEHDEEDDEAIIKAAASQAGVVHDASQARQRQAEEDEKKAREEQERRKREEVLVLEKSQVSARTEVQCFEEQERRKILELLIERQQQVNARHAKAQKDAELEHHEKAKTQQVLSLFLDETESRAFITDDEDKEWESRKERTREKLELQTEKLMLIIEDDETQDRKAIFAQEDAEHLSLRRETLSRLPFWRAIRHRLPGLEKDKGHRAERTALFSDFDQNEVGYLSLTEIDSSCRQILQLDQVTSNLKPILMRAFVAAKESRRSHGKKKKYGDDFVERAEFRLIFVYINRYFELWFLVDSVEPNGETRRVSPEELKSALSSLQGSGNGQILHESAEELFSKIDVDDRGFILFDEFADRVIINSSEFNCDAVDDDCVEATDTHELNDQNAKQDRNSSNASEVSSAKSNKEAVPPAELQSTRKPMEAKERASVSPDDDDDGDDSDGDDSYGSDFDSPTKADSPTTAKVDSSNNSACSSTPQRDHRSSRRSSRSSRSTRSRSSSQSSHRNYSCDSSQSSLTPTPRRNNVTHEKKQPNSEHRTSRASLLRQRVASSRRINAEKETSPSKVLPRLKEPPRAKSVNEVLKEQAIRAPKLYNAPAVRAWAKSVMPPITIKKRAASPQQAGKSPRSHKDPQEGEASVAKKRLADMTDEELSLALRNQLNSMKQVPRLSKQARVAKRTDMAHPPIAISGVTGITTSSAVLELNRRIKPDEDIKILLSKDQGKIFSLAGVISGGSVGSSPSILLGGLTMGTQYFARCTPSSDKSPTEQQDTSGKPSKVKQIVVHFTTHAGRSAVRGDALVDSSQTQMEPMNTPGVELSVAKEFARAIDAVYSKTQASKRVVNRSPYLY